MSEPLNHPQSTTQSTAGIDHWGYLLLPPPYPECLGHSGLLMAIRAKPTQQHFDPESVRVRFLEPPDTARWATLRLHTPVAGARSVFPGRIILTDQKGKGVEFFTFGGLLEVAAEPQQAVIQFRSPAPVLEITGDSESVTDQLASQAEVVIAELQAGWVMREEGFVRRVAELDPAVFYAVIVQAILQRYERAHTLLLGERRLQTALLKERENRRGAGRWPANLPGLDQLVGKDSSPGHTGTSHTQV
jgi:hypothetical protein